MSASLRPTARASAFSSAIAWASGLGPARGRSTRLTRRTDRLTVARIGESRRGLRLDRDGHVNRFIHSDRLR